MNIDCWKIISLYLPFNGLNLNKELSTIYNNLWFKNKLLIYDPNITSNNYDFSWDLLYKRFLKSGQIFKYNDQKNIIKKFDLMNVIKIAKIEIELSVSISEDFDYLNFYLILTFEGNLYSFHKIKNDI